MISNKNIGHVLDRLRDLGSNWRLPSVSEMALERQDPFRVLISTLLSLRTKDSVTLRASLRLFAVADTPQDMMRLSKLKIERLIFPVAFYRVKAGNILEVCRTLLEKHRGHVPRTIDDLVQLKGVGRKTANLTMILGFGEPAMCVDTHVHRISNRLGYIKTKTADESEFALRKRLPKKYWLSYNDLLVQFGQNLCKPVSPHCSVCPVKACPRVGVNKSR